MSYELIKKYSEDDRWLDHLKGIEKLKGTAFRYFIDLLVFFLRNLEKEYNLNIYSIHLGWQVYAFKIEYASLQEVFGDRRAYIEASTEGDIFVFMGKVRDGFIAVSDDNVASFTIFLNKNPYEVKYYNTHGEEVDV